MCVCVHLGGIIVCHHACYILRCAQQCLWVYLLVCDSAGAPVCLCMSLTYVWPLYGWVCVVPPRCIWAIRAVVYVYVTSCLM